MKSVMIYGSPVPYEIARVKKRKTIQIAFTPEGLLKVKIPYAVTEGEAEKILLSKANWIHKQRQRLADLSDNPTNGNFAPDALLLYLGQEYRLKLIAADKDLVFIQGETLVVQCSAPPAALPEAAQKLLLNWYIDQARTALVSRTRYWAQRIGVSPLRITIRDQKTRWGSCSTRGSLNYSWRLIMAPSPVLDYLVIHELCHMKVANHSSTFWRLVANYTVDYNSHRRWLKDNGRLLMRLFTRQ